MSYFTFGLVLVNPGGHENIRRAEACAEACGRAARITIRLGGTGEPAMLAEMRGEFSPQSAFPFRCVDDSTGDTSEGLITADGFAAIARWAKCLVTQPGIDGLMLWVSYGYDDAFARFECSPEELEQLLGDNLDVRNELPSMLLTIRRPSTASI